MLRHFALLLVVAVAACSPKSSSNPPPESTPESSSSTGAVIERVHDVKEAGQQLERVQVAHTPPKRRGKAQPQQTLVFDVAEGTLTSTTEGKTVPLGRIVVDDAGRQVQLQRGAKTALRIKRQPTGYLVYDAGGALLFSGRRTNLGWDLMPKPSATAAPATVPTDNTKAVHPHATDDQTRLARHVGGSLETPGGRMTAIERSGSIYVGGPGVGKLVVRGLSVEAAALLGYTSRPLDERLALAVFVHTMGRERRPSSTSTP